MCAVDACLGHTYSNVHQHTKRLCRACNELQGQALSTVTTKLVYVQYRLSLCSSSALLLLGAQTESTQRTIQLLFRFRDTVYIIATFPMMADARQTQEETQACNGGTGGTISSMKETSTSERAASVTKSTMSGRVSKRHQQTSKKEKGTPARRRRGLRQARSELSKQFEALRRILPDEESGSGRGKAKVLESAIKEIERLMNRATFLAVELAVASPEATQKWVRACAQDGHRPLFHTVATVMKLFAVQFDWRYAEWWTLDECDVNVNVDNAILSTSLSASGQQLTDVVARDGKPDGAIADMGNVHGCVVRDSASVMRLAWTVVHRDRKATTDGDEQDDEDGIVEFARKSQSFKFGPRVGMPGRVWTSRRAEWLVDLRDREVFLRSPLAEKFGMQTCLAVPIQFGGHVHSIMAFYSREQRAYDPDAYDLACVLARSLSEVYAPSRSAPWHNVSDSIFSPQSV